MFDRDLLGKPVCKDDEEIDLDCGHTAVAGDDYMIIHFEVTDKDGKVTKIKKTTCVDTDTKCDCDVCFETLNKYQTVRMLGYDWEHLKTADEEWDDYQDYLADRDDD